jgi:hypothetical protein
MEMHSQIDTWTDKSNETNDPRVMEVMDVSDALIRFYGLRPIEGRLEVDDDQLHVVINEAAMKALGWTTAVGKKLDDYTVVGVVKNFYTAPPTIPVEPVMLRGTFERDGYRVMSSNKTVLLKFREGSFPELKQRILGNGKMLGQLHHVEEEYDKLLTSERLLFRLLGLAALTCVLIAAFGIFSLVSLSCQQRRKEIAIRKVNGARIGDILALFIREYLLMLMLAAVVAFPVGYVLMKRWLQSYADQISIEWWLYVVIFAGTAAVVALCIGWRVWQAARSNPAETIKAE